MSLLSLRFGGMRFLWCTSECGRHFDALLGMETAVALLSRCYLAF